MCLQPTRSQVLKLKSSVPFLHNSYHLVLAVTGSVFTVKSHCYKHALVDGQLIKVIDFCLICALISIGRYCNHVSKYEN